LRVRKWILSGGRGDWCIELGGIEAFGAVPEFIKLGLSNLCPVGDGPSLDCAKGAIAPDHLEQVSKTNREGGDKTIYIHEGEGVMVSLGKD